MTNMRRDALVECDLPRSKERFDSRFAPASFIDLGLVIDVGFRGSHSSVACNYGEGWDDAFLATYGIENDLDRTAYYPIALGPAMVARRNDQIARAWGAHTIAT